MDAAELRTWALSEEAAARRRELAAVDCTGNHRAAVAWEQGYARAMRAVADKLELDVIIDLRGEPAVHGEPVVRFPPRQR